MGDPTISVLVLNYNGVEHLGPCFDSLLAQDFPADRLQLIFVDNGSSDDSVAFMAARYPTVRVIEHGVNLGFAEGYDRAAELVDGDYLAFLNNDTRVASNWLTELVQPCVEDPAIACVASLMLDWDGRQLDFADSAINYIGWGFQLHHGEPYCPQELARKDLFFACGGAMLIERRAFLDAGCFDPDYFAYFEDVDLGWRLRLRGDRTVFAPEAIVFHRHHGTAAALNSAQRWALLERNALQSVLKNYDDGHLAAILPAAILLLWERAFLDLLPPPPPAALPANGDVAYGPGYYLWQLVGLLRAGSYHELDKRARAELGRRWRRLWPVRPERGRIEPDMITPDMAGRCAGRLLAGQAILEGLPKVKRKRELVQAERRGTDRNIFPLFRSPLQSNFNNDRFIEVMAYVSRRFAIPHIFGGDRIKHRVPAVGLDKSWAVSQKLLEIAAEALAMSGIPRGNFQLGCAQLPEISELSENSIRVLGDMDDLVCSLPRLSSDRLLNWLDDRCSDVLSRAQSMAKTSELQVSN